MFFQSKRLPFNDTQNKIPSNKRIIHHKDTTIMHNHPNFLHKFHTPFMQYYLYTNFTAKSPNTPF